MTVPYGHHARRRTPVPVAVRHVLLWLLPSQPGAHDTWHDVGCAFGDLLEDFFSLLAIVLMLGIGAVIALILAWLSPLLLAAVLLVGVFVLAVRRLRARVRDIEHWVDEEAPR